MKIGQRLSPWVCLLVLGCASVAKGEPRVGTEPTSAFTALDQPDRPMDERDVFESLPDEQEDLGTLLVNGRPADRRFFPTVFNKTSGQPCTATLVGPAAILTAAHCMPNNVNSRFKLGAISVVGRCRHAPTYDPNLRKFDDWALCLLKFPILDVMYESIGSEIPSRGTVTLTGYGCRHPSGTSGDGILRIGTAELAPRPSGLPPEPSLIYTNTDIDADGVAVCPGDSGGPLFLFHGASMNSARTLIAVNSSRVNEAPGISLFAATGAHSAFQFFKAWAMKHSQEICGVRANHDIVKPKIECR